MYFWPAVYVDLKKFGLAGLFLHVDTSNEMLFLSLSTHFLEEIKVNLKRVYREIMN